MPVRPLLPGALLLLLSFLPLSALATPGVTWFGGTRWDPVDGRWEAVEDSVWTFESGVGSTINTDPSRKWVGMHLLSEGWSSEDRSGPQPPELTGWLRRMTTDDFGTTVCVGSPAGLGGTASFWAGVTQDEADSLGWAGGQGYGNRWNVLVEKEFAYDGSGTATLEYDYAVDSEPGFDYVYVEVDTSNVGDWVTLAWYDGVDSGSESLLLTAGVDLPSGPGPIRIRFQFNSDGAYSDEDGQQLTDCGLGGFDNVSFAGGPVDDFETGDDGWTAPAYPPAGHSPGVGGDWVDIRAVDSLVPDYLLGPCDLGDSALVMFRPDFPGAGGGDHKCGQDNAAVSPWIDLQEAGAMDRSGLVIELDTYFEPGSNYDLYYEVQWYPAVRLGFEGPTLSAWTPYLPPRPFYQLGCSIGPERVQVDLSGIVPSYAEEIRVAIRFYDRCWFILCDCFMRQTHTPWFDDIRVAVFEPSPIAAEPPPVTPPPLRLALHPTPMRAGTSGSIRFTLPADGPVTLSVFDVRGRERALLYAGPTPAGDHTVPWRGTDAAGTPLPAGIYLLRLQTPGGETTAKTVILGK